MYIYFIEQIKKPTIIVQLAKSLLHVKRICPTYNS